jgi:hypothetical protein
MNAKPRTTPTSVQWAARRSAAFASVQKCLRGATEVLDMVSSSGPANICKNIAAARAVLNDSRRSLITGRLRPLSGAAPPRLHLDPHVQPAANRCDDGVPRRTLATANPNAPTEAKVRMA